VFAEGYLGLNFYLFDLGSLMGKYDPLKEFLSLHRENEIPLTLRQIEIIVSAKLPKSARAYSAWWSEPVSHPQVRSWSDVGWKVKVHSEEGSIEWVMFQKLARAKTRKAIT